MSRQPNKITGANAGGPSEAKLWEIPNHLLRVSVRKAEQLPNDTVSSSVVGLKSKAVDVVVTKEANGPVLAISVKGTGNAFWNLTNRMEEAIGDSANLHITHPG